MTGCHDCCRQSGNQYVLAEQQRDFIVAGECCDCPTKKAKPVKPGVEIHQYQLLALEDDGMGGVWLVPAVTGLAPEMIAGFALHCFFATDTGGMAYLSRGGFKVDMAVMPDGFVWDAAAISAFEKCGLCPETVHGLEC